MLRFRTIKPQAIGLVIFCISSVLAAKNKGCDKCLDKCWNQHGSHWYHLHQCQDNCVLKTLKRCENKCDDHSSLPEYGLICRAACREEAHFRCFAECIRNYGSKAFQLSA
ncbi:hypothetical protein CRM22_007316 [Opisthorchis felineus]|uniref:Uncharacterized protein n=1 Tax=Opisthorchis felineus TaxID=147828 RepID=A0A4S2LH33_OPIFE|nr:hypothetical protein CRM22_007316 [Opisthorchis felineus]TGZ62651.1 hypothetical protein CRM22_007316 [Opisthorchis felineus]